MTKRAININLGTHDAERRKEALRQLVEHLDITGRNLVPSISEAICRLADAAELDLEQTAYLFNEIMMLANTGYIVEAEEMQK